MFSHISVKTDLRVQRNSRIKGTKFRTLLVRSKRACTWVRDSQGDQKRREGLWVTSLSCQDLPQCTHHHQRHQDTITHSFFHSAPPLCTRVHSHCVCLCECVGYIRIYTHVWKAVDWYSISSSVALHLISWDSVSHWAWRFPFSWTGWFGTPQNSPVSPIPPSSPNSGPHASATTYLLNFLSVFLPSL